MGAGGGAALELDEEGVVPSSTLCVPPPPSPLCPRWQSAMGVGVRELGGVGPFHKWGD